MPYETKGYDQIINAEETCASNLVVSSECSLANLSGIRYSDYRGTNVDAWDSMKKNHEGSLKCRRHSENSSDESSEYTMRQKRLSENSVSSDCSSRSLEEQEPTFLISDLLKHRNENLVFHDENNNMCV